MTVYKDYYTEKEKKVFFLGKLRRDDTFINQSRFLLVISGL